MSRAKIAVHALLFLYLAATLGALWAAMKPIPSFVLLAPLALHAVAHAAHVERLRTALAAFSFWVGLALASTVGMYAAAEFIHPSITDDGNRVMPIGQAFFAMVVGPIVGLVLGYVVKRKVDPPPSLTSRSEPHPRIARSLVLHGLFAVLLTIAIARGLRG